jgi:hypothetical protein
MMPLEIFILFLKILKKHKHGQLVIVFFVI